MSYPYKIRIHSLDPTLADIRIDFEDLPSDVEVRGRLMGPRCPGVSTVEIAYSLVPVRGGSPGMYQVLIPEPNLWSEDRPNRYEGPVEFWRQGQQIEQTTVAVGIR